MIVVRLVVGVVEMGVVVVEVEVKVMGVLVVVEVVVHDIKETLVEILVNIPSPRASLSGLANFLYRPQMRRGGMKNRLSFFPNSGTRLTEKE